MDNERAIEAIKGFIVFHLGFLSGEQYEAMELAIKALEEKAEWDKLKLICANEGVMVYKVRGKEE